MTPYDQEANADKWTHVRPYTPPVTPRGRMAKRGWLGVLFVCLGLFGLYQGLFVSKEERFEELRQAVQQRQRDSAVVAKYDAATTSQEDDVAFGAGAVVAGMVMVAWGVKVGERRARG